MRGGGRNVGEQFNKFFLTELILKTLDLEFCRAKESSGGRGKTRNVTYFPLLLEFLWLNADPQSTMCYTRNAKRCNEDSKEKNANKKRALLKISLKGKEVNCFLSVAWRGQ